MNASASGRHLAQRARRAAGFLDLDAATLVSSPVGQLVPYYILIAPKDKALLLEEERSATWQYHPRSISIKIHPGKTGGPEQVKDRVLLHGVAPPITFGIIDQDGPPLSK
jgi:hypothetical protein